MPKRPRDPNQLGKLIVDIATGESPDDVSPKKKAPDTHGRTGGLKGGNARAKALSPERRRSIAKKAAKARWNKA